MATNNVVFVEGNLCDDAHLYSTNSGLPKVTFRLAISREDTPGTADFITVVGIGKKWVDLLALLRKSTRVVVVGRIASRDLRDGSVAVEIRPSEVGIIPAEALAWRSALRNPTCGPV